MTEITSTTSEDTTLAVRSKTDALAANPQLAAQTSAIEVLKQKAMILIDSGLLPDSIKKWQQAAAIMMRAEELDVDYWTGLMHLPAIKGMPQPDGQLCMALILRSELMERFEILATTDQICTLRMKRVGQPAFDVTCTFQEYEKVAGPDSRRQPKTHLFWYTYKQGARRLFSDVLNNMQPKQKTRRVIIQDDLPSDLPDDDVYVIEEGEEAPMATLPLSAAPSASGAPIVSADSGESGTLAIGQVYERFEAPESPALGSLDMKALQDRALHAGLADNEFHFGNLLKQLLADGTICEGATGDNILAAMSKHKADKEAVHEGEFDEAFPLSESVPQEPPPTIGSLNMESLWMRSRINPKSAFHQTIRDMKKAGKIKDNLTADQVVDAIKAHLAAVAFTVGEAGGVEP